MEHFWIAVFTSLTFVAWASSSQVVLERKPKCDSSGPCTWNWVPEKKIGPDIAGWSLKKSSADARTVQYGACDVDLQPPNPHPSNWLISDQITVSDANRIDITVEYSISNCSNFQPGNGGPYCVNYFDLYVNQSDYFIKEKAYYPNPLQNTAAYENVTRIGRLTNVRTLETIHILNKGKYLLLAFHNDGACSTLYSVKVTYYVCPAEPLDNSLVSLARTVAPANDSQPILVEGSCEKDALLVGGSLYVHCQSDGEWNTSGLKGKCICKEDMQDVGGKCQACPDGIYNDQNGLNCTVLPSAPRNVNVKFINQSSVEIRWLPPSITGDQTEVLYDVDCRKPCDDDDGNKCVDESCGSDVTFIPYKEGLNVTHVKITNIWTFVNYTFKIYAGNRVSEVAKRIHGVRPNFMTITVRTNGSSPGKLDVSVEQPESVVFVSWILKQKNGIIKDYHVTYIREDDSSDSKTLTTQKMEQRFEDLMAGKTYEFQAFAMNNFGRGPTGVKTFTLREADSKTAFYEKIIYGMVGLFGVLIIVIISFACYIVNIRNRRRHRKRVEQNVVTITTESRIRADEDVTMFSMGEYQNIDDIRDGFQLDRDQITLVRLLGAGNFGQVSKAIYGTSRSEVAVKTLKDNATQKDLKDMLSELDVMKSLQPHPHVVKLIGCCIERDPLLIVLEYLPYGDLLGYLRKSRGIEDAYNTGEKRPNSRLSDKDLLSFAWMIADGMNYLATMKVVHRDLAARNVLVGEDKVCKISDFGLARGLEGDHVYTRQTQARLPVKWMPPESLFYGESTTMSDVWSYGIVMWEVFTIGESPYPGINSRQVAALLQTGYRMPRPRHLSEELYSIMSECWAEQPKTRPSFRWLCSAVRRLLDDQKTYVNLEYYNDKDYVNFDMIQE